MCIRDSHNIGQSESSKTVGFSDLFFMTAYADEELVLKEEDLKNELKNITSVDLDVYRNVGGEDINDGLVLYCYNSGHVSGRQDLGGIGGTMGIESAVKYGDNITLPGGKVISGNSIVKAVVNGCVCQGEVEGKRGCEMCIRDRVQVENDISAYLPAETETKRGLDLMESQFVTSDTFSLMISNISYDRAEAMTDRIERVDGVKEVAFDDSANHYNNSSALYDITSVSYTQLDVYKRQHAGSPD